MPDDEQAKTLHDYYLHGPVRETTADVKSKFIADPMLKRDLRPTTTAVLELFAREDSIAWMAGCRELNISVLSTSIKSDNTDMAALSTFFGKSADWFYFSGHYGEQILENDSQTVSVEFIESEVKITAGIHERHIKKEGYLKIHNHCKLTVWAGCSVCKAENDVKILRSLFGPHLLLGFAGRTGSKMVHTFLGDIKTKGSFFNLIKEDPANLKTIRDAWMEVSKKLYGGGKIEDRPRAIDSDGQEWKIVKGEIIKGRKIP